MSLPELKSVTAESELGCRDAGSVELCLAAIHRIAREVD